MPMKFIRQLASVSNAVITEEPMQEFKHLIWRTLNSARHMTTFRSCQWIIGHEPAWFISHFSKLWPMQGTVYEVSNFCICTRYEKYT